jgi:hypothetical protein
LYGITFGNEKVQKWITSQTISVLSNVFFTQPMQVIITTIITVSICRRKTELGQEKMKEDQKFDASATVNDHLDLKEEIRPALPKTSGRVKNYDQSRSNSIKERKIRDALKKLVLHGIFMAVLFIVAYSSRNIYAFQYQNSLSQLLINDKPDSDQITSFNYVIICYSHNY